MGGDDGRSDDGFPIDQQHGRGFAAIYILFGIAGFFVADRSGGEEGALLLGFQVNHLHSIVHLLIGLALFRVDFADRGPCARMNVW